MANIKENIQQILTRLPAGVTLEAAAKARTAREVLEAINAGVKIIGENYIQEAETAFNEIGRKAKWHFIGRLQKNKIKKAVGIFDVIETVDSFGTALEIDSRCGQAGRTIEVFLEVNSGREEQKNGVFPENCRELAEKISELKNIRITGLMTMGPMFADPEGLRPYFRETKELFEKIKALGLPNADVKNLSMGMSDSYKVAAEEGATIVRVGTAIFGPRK